MLRAATWGEVVGCKLQNKENYPSVVKTKFQTNQLIPHQKKELISLLPLIISNSDLGNVYVQCLRAFLKMAYTNG